MTFKHFYVLALAYLSFDILYRRLVFNAIPTQVSGPVVYVLLALNAVVAYRLVVSSTKKNKS